MKDSTSILLFFRSTESHGKTRSVFTPPVQNAEKNKFKKTKGACSSPISMV
jgi:hypothetical protein